MSATTDWREGARAEYRARRADLAKKLAAAERAERKAGERVTALNRQIEDLEAGARAFGLDDLPSMTEEMVSEAIAMRDGAQASAKDIILDALAERHPEPMKAKELRQIIEDKLGRPVHYKTPGMTLYRLAEDDLVRRDFHDWYITDKGRLTRAGLVMAETVTLETSDEPPFDPFDFEEPQPDDPATEPDQPEEPDDADFQALLENDPDFAEQYLRAKGRTM